MPNTANAKIASESLPVARDSADARSASLLICMCAGRVLLSLIFVLSGAHKILNWNDTMSRMQDEGMLYVPILLAGAIILELGGGLFLFTGLRPRLGATMLVVFLIPTTLIFHDFWAYDGAAQQTQMIQFMKNLAILGGLLVVIAARPRSNQISSKPASTTVGPT